MLTAVCTYLERRGEALSTVALLLEEFDMTGDRCLNQGETLILFKVLSVIPEHATGREFEEQWRSIYEDLCTTVLSCELGKGIDEAALLELCTGTKNEALGSKYHFLVDAVSPSRIRSSPLLKKTRLARKLFQKLGKARDEKPSFEEVSPLLFGITVGDVYEQMGMDMSEGVDESSFVAMCYIVFASLKPSDFEVYMELYGLAGEEREFAMVRMRQKMQQEDPEMAGNLQDAMTGAMADAAANCVLS